MRITVAFLLKGMVLTLVAIRFLVPDNIVKAILRWRNENEIGKFSVLIESVDVCR